VAAVGQCLDGISPASVLSRTQCAWPSRPTLQVASLREAFARRWILGPNRVFSWPPLAEKSILALHVRQERDAAHAWAQAA